MIEPTYTFPHAELDTAIGKVNLWSTGKDHVGVTQAEGGAVTIRAIDYTVRMDLHPESYHAASTADRYREPFSYPFPFDSHRYGPDTYDLGAILLHRIEGWVDGSAAAKRKAAEVIVPAVNAFLETEAGRELVNAGEVERQAQAARRARDEVAAAKAELDKAEAALAALEAEA